jgi:hypothetical protein
MTGPTYMPLGWEMLLRSHAGPRPQADQSGAQLDATFVDPKPQLRFLTPEFDKPQMTSHPVDDLADAMRIASLSWTHCHRG